MRGTRSSTEGVTGCRCSIYPRDRGSDGCQRGRPRFQGLGPLCSAMDHLELPFVVFSPFNAGCRGGCWHYNGRRWQYFILLRKHHCSKVGRRVIGYPRRRRLRGRIYVPCGCTVIDDIRYLHLLCDALINDIFCLFCAEESAADSHSTRSCPLRLTMPLFNLRDISDESLSIASSYVVRFSCLVLKDFIDIDPPGLPHTRF
jgi:hypothetical protein